MRPSGVVLGELGRWSLWATWRRIRRRLGSPTWRGGRFRTANELRGLCTAAGLRVERLRGAIYYPPVLPVAWLMTPLDRQLGRLTTLGAAFLAVAAVRPNKAV